MDLGVERLTKELESDFLALMARDEHGGKCWCVAWWVPTWDQYAESTSQQNRTLREELLANGAHDGYLAYADGAPVSWTQVGPRDRLPKIAEVFSLDPDPDAWAISCFLVLQPYRGRGVAREVFAAVLDDLRRTGVRTVEGYPLHGSGHEAEEVWTGPESLFVAAGFEQVAQGPRRSVYRLDLVR